MARRYRAYLDYTAQSHNVRSLLQLHHAHASAQTGLIPPTTVVVFTAFSIESYVNSLGARFAPFWDEIERMPWRAKINILHRITDRTPDWGSQPLQFATDVFGLRDRLAHGKPERVVSDAYENRDEAIACLDSAILQPHWMSKLDAEWVQSSRTKFRQLANYLGGLFGLHESDHLRLCAGDVIEIEQGAIAEDD